VKKIENSLLTGGERHFGGNQMKILLARVCLVKILSKKLLLPCLANRPPQAGEDRLLSKRRPTEIRKTTFSVEISGMRLMSLLSKTMRQCQWRSLEWHYSEEWDGMAKTVALRLRKPSDVRRSLV
jgi:hypothetical protein